MRTLSLLIFILVMLPPVDAAPDWNDCLSSMACYVNPSCLSMPMNAFIEVSRTTDVEHLENSEDNCPLYITISPFNAKKWGVIVHDESADIAKGITVKDSSKEDVFTCKKTGVISVPTLNVSNYSVTDPGVQCSFTISVADGKMTFKDVLPKMKKFKYHAGNAPEQSLPLSYDTITNRVKCRSVVSYEDSTCNAAGESCKQLLNVTSSQGYECPEHHTLLYQHNGSDWTSASSIECDAGVYIASSNKTDRQLEEGDIIAKCARKKCRQCTNPNVTAKFVEPEQYDQCVYLHCDTPLMLINGNITHPKPDLNCSDAKWKVDNAQIAIKTVECVEKYDCSKLVPYAPNSESDERKLSSLSLDLVVTCDPLYQLAFVEESTSKELHASQISCDHATGLWSIWDMASKAIAPPMMEMRVKCVHKEVVILDQSTTTTETHLDETTIELLISIPVIVFVMIAVIVIVWLCWLKTQKKKQKKKIAKKPPAMKKTTEKVEVVVKKVEEKPAVLLVTGSESQKEKDNSVTSSLRKAYKFAKETVEKVGVVIRKSPIPKILAKFGMKSRDPRLAVFEKLDRTFSDLRLENIPSPMTYDDEESRRVRAIVEDMLKKIKAYVSGAKKISFKERNLIDFVYDDLLKLIGFAQVLFEMEPKSIPVKFPVVVVGDLHGNFQDLINIFRHIDNKTEEGFDKATFVFMGDYVDRGPYQLEVIATLFSLKIAYPERFVILRGNHEAKDTNWRYGLKDECIERYPIPVERDRKTDLKTVENELFNCLNEAFTHMPVSALVGEQLLAVHGGISSRLISRESLEQIPSPLSVLEKVKMVFDMLWSDPHPDDDGINECPSFEQNRVRGCSVYFSSNDLKTVCESLDIKMVIRGHQGMGMDAMRIGLQERLVTLFSSASVLPKGVKPDWSIYKNRTAAGVLYLAKKPEDDFFEKFEPTIIPGKDFDRLRLYKINDPLTATQARALIQETTPVEADESEKSVKSRKSQLDQVAEFDNTVRGDGEEEEMEENEVLARITAGARKKAVMRTKVGQSMSAKKDEPTDEVDLPEEEEEGRGLGPEPSVGNQPKSEMKKDGKKSNEDKKSEKSMKDKKDAEKEDKKDSKKEGKKDAKKEDMVADDLDVEKTAPSYKE